MEQLGRVSVELRTVLGTEPEVLPHWASVPPDLHPSVLKYSYFLCKGLRAHPPLIGRIPEVCKGCDV